MTSNTRDRFFGGAFTTFLVIAMAITTAAQVVITQSEVQKGGIPGTDGKSGFPVAIIKPGSYRLGSDLVVTGTSDAIDIHANDVSLDLNGFAILGPVTCTRQGRKLDCQGTSNGTGVYNMRNSVSVRNGSVKGFQNGVANYGGPGVVLEDLNTSENLGFGIISNGGIVTKCTSSRNISAGFLTSIAQVKGNAASENGGDGIQLFEGGATENISSQNGGYGFYVQVGLLSNNASMSNGLGEILGLGITNPGNNACNGAPC